MFWVVCNIEIENGVVLITILCDRRQNKYPPKNVILITPDLPYKFNQNSHQCPWWM